MKKTFALMVGITALFLAGCSTTHRPAHWEYTQAADLNQANALGASGWEVVGFWYGQGSSIYVLKRPLNR